MDNLESRYRINVAEQNRHISHMPDGSDEVGYTHHFAVNVTSEKKAKVIFAELSVKYPKPDYCVDVTFWDIGGSMKHWSIDQHNEVYDVYDGK